MGNGRPARRKMQKKSLAVRTQEAEARAQQAGAALLNMRQMYEQAITEKAALQQRAAQMETFVAALAIEYGNRDEIEVSAQALVDLRDVAGFSFENTEEGGFVIILSWADLDEESEDTPDEE